MSLYADGGGDRVLEIEDDGHGFDPIPTTPRTSATACGTSATGRGALGGHAEISSVISEGTLIRVVVPR
ncbi:MAG TPA: hypothetical protein VG276_00065 [Actinomycetes bacterium]|nr:hypothetical protein [Actinomycetes bacterium]